MHKEGVPVVLRPELEVEHLNPAPTARFRATKAYQSDESRSVFVQKHGPQVLTDAIQLTSPWSVAVRGASGLMWSTRSVERLGAPVDALLPRVSPTIGRELAGVLIEAAGAASLH